VARQITWTPPVGDPIVLTDRGRGYRVLADGTKGLDSVTYRTAAQVYAGVPGAELQTIEADVRQFSLGLSIEGDTESEFRDRKRALIRSMRPKAGDGVLSFADEAGARRSISCRYMGGLEGDAVAYFDGLSWRPVAQFVAFDPWFRGPAVTLEFGLGAPQSFFPFFPLRLAPSAIQGQFVVDLGDTDAPSFPLWTVMGPGTALTLTNNTTGRQIVVNAALAAGETMIIDTRPGRQSVRRGDGSNLMNTLTSDPALWPLVEGVNNVTALLAGATANSRVAGVYEPRYAGI